MNYEVEKISELDVLSTADNNDILVIDDVSASDTKKITKQNLLKEVNNDITSLESRINQSINAVDNKIGDLAELETTDKTDVVSAVNETDRKIDLRDNYMIAVPSQSQTLTAPNTITKVNLDTVAINSGDLLSFNSTAQGIVIGPGVHHIEVSGEIYVVTPGTSSLKNVYVYRNDNIIATRGLIYINTGYQTIFSGVNIIEVSEGDVITLRANSQSGNTTSLGPGYANGSLSYLMVKVID